MPIPSYNVIADSLFGTGKAIPASMLLGLRNNVCALFGIDPATASPTVSFGMRGEIFANDTGVYAVNATVSGAGPYTWTVPAGITKIIVDIVGGGGGGSDNIGPTYGVNGTASTLSGSTSGALVTANKGDAGSGGGPGAPGAASGFCGAGIAVERGRTRKTGWITGTGNAEPGMGGTGTGSSAGGAAGGEGMVAVVPGETITITIGAGGAAAASPSTAGQPGYVRIRF